jgi:hypothetical protein
MPPCIHVGEKTISQCFMRSNTINVNALMLYL